MRGYKVETLDQLMEIADRRGSVVTERGWRTSAAFMINMQARQVWIFLNTGLYFYISREWRQPIALLPWRGEIIQIGDEVAWGGPRKRERVGEVFAKWNDFLYVLTLAGSAFIEESRVQILKPEDW